MLSFSAGLTVLLFRNDKLHFLPMISDAVLEHMEKRSAAGSWFMPSLSWNYLLLARRRQDLRMIGFL